MGHGTANCLNLAWPVVSKFMQNLSSNVRVVLSLLCLLLPWTFLHGYKNMYGSLNMPIRISKL